MVYARCSIGACGAVVTFCQGLWEGGNTGTPSLAKVRDVRDVRHLRSRHAGIAPDFKADCPIAVPALRIVDRPLRSAAAHNADTW